MQAILHTIAHRIKTYIYTQRFLKAATYLVVLLLLFNGLVFAYYNAMPLIKSDGWRFIKIYLETWYNNELQWNMLWKDHHPQPVTALLFIANANYFSLRMDYEAVFATSFSLFSLITLWKTYSEQETQPALSKYLFILIASALLLSLNSTAVYSWSLVTLGHIYVFFGLLTVTSINNIMRSNFKLSSILVSLLSIALLLILYSEGAKLLIYSSIVIVFIAYLYERNTKWLIPIGVIILSIVLQIIFLQTISSESKYTELSAVTSIIKRLNHIHEYILYIGVGLLSAWINIGAITGKLGVSHQIIYLGGIAALAINLFTLYFFYRKKIYAISIVPGTLIVTSILTAMGAAMFRFHPEAQDAISADVPRYYLLYALGAIGIAWTWSLILRNMHLKTPGKVACFSVISIVLISQAIFANNAWHSMHYRKKAYYNAYKIMVKNAAGDLSVKPPRFLTGRNYPEPYLSGLEFLKEHQLNVFGKTDMMDKFTD